MIMSGGRSIVLKGFKTDGVTSDLPKITASYMLPLIWDKTLTQSAYLIQKLE